jgi:hypothetical protein
MAILKFNESDRLSSIVVPTDWYKLELVEIDGPKQSSSQKSYNFFIKIQITTGQFAGKEFTIVFNTATKSESVLGTQQFFPTAAFLKLGAAITNVPLDQISLDLDTDSLLRKPFDGKVEKGIHEGVPMNTIIQFLPAGTGADVKSPF